MRSVTLILAFALLLLAVAYLLYETWGLAEVAGQQETVARLAGSEVVRLEGELHKESAKGVALAAEVARLEGQLALTAAQLGAMADVVKGTQESAAARAKAAREANQRALAAMPEGVRQCLAALHKALYAEGYTGVRFLRAASLDKDGLHGVEAIRTHEDGLGADLIVAGTMLATLDRAKQRLLLTFFEGSRVQNGERIELPEAGWSIDFQPVDGQRLEQDLPFLIDAKGIYPSEDNESDRPAVSDVDRRTRIAWLERFDRLLEDSGTKERIQVQRFRGIADGMFLEAQLLATDALGRVQFGATCKRLAVEVDRAARVVSLVLRDGILRRGQAESTISSAGYRMLLPNVKPDAAIEIMLGLVVMK